MARSLRYWLGAPERTQLDPGDVPLALGALLVRLARAEEGRLIREAAAIDAILARRHELTAQEALEMRETCEALAEFAPETARFAAILRVSVPYADRLSIARCLCEVMRVAGAEEEALVALAETVLGVPAQDIAPPRRAG
ncbi:TerB family tellurite resistance protein [Salipiger mucosus]|uniref:Co-chaperone DjlA N-terminal domain-containing protein n=1 Tax=Salipiger mucosus DSM 16094 TaxID=1123237 RepID=S9RPF0_9RHOB|nr:TerB family tellurite resistance protein [Salipiger mucosus]EPX75909.1 hypothetical protein Salmuc_02305 [Salipiger mucosus DSM 16094]